MIHYQVDTKKTDKEATLLCDREKVLQEEKMEFKNIILMSAGIHVKESYDHIIARKKQEYLACGKMFWGYGSNCCHPLTQVQPFLKENMDKGEKTYLLLYYTDNSSQRKSEEKIAKEYSYNKKEYEDLPDKVEVRFNENSNKVLICGELFDCDFTLNLEKYEVAMGEKAGKLLSGYISGQSDKACARLSENICTRPVVERKICCFAEVLGAAFVR